jgi:hypothetical protein
MNLQNLEYDNELNLRLQARNIPSQSLTPLFDFRPTPTKYTWFGTIEEKKTADESLNRYGEYSPYKVFNPGCRGPTQYYFNVIDEESKLQHRFMALQKADQAVYVPEMTSQLYKNQNAFQKVQYANEEVSYPSRQVNPDLDSGKFFNHTRTNLKQPRKPKK